MPSFSVTLTRRFPGQAPREVLALRDWRPANKRDLHLDLHPRDSNPFVETANAQFAGSFAYGAEYPAEGRDVARQHEPSSLGCSSPSASPSTSSEEGGDTSTTEADWSHEPEHEEGSDIDSGDETTTLSDGDLGQLEDRDPPLHRQAPLLTSITQAPSLPPRLRKFNTNASVSTTSPSTLSSSPRDEYKDDIASLASTTERDPNRQFESPRNIGPENTAAPEGAVEDSSGPDPPPHCQMASSNPLVQTPPLPHPHYNHHAIQMHVLDAHTRQVSREGSNAVRRRPPVREPSSSGRFTGWSLVLSTSTILRSLWRKLKRVCGLVLKGFTKDL
ncbi:hypothetical protein FA13DRAFT_1793182 [Coprinellus micaceus]|uniref:Uncharacterized protein n=1 Tax=Coprinellus micaceus TaxID=71717 RepID=A0A4Y7T676_COPMI|nr:hypothetical protein FA13DRAFT_1793182 [Coprinellus micaceus]